MSNKLRLSDEALSRQGYDDATCNNGFTEEFKNNHSYIEGYRLGLRNRLRWAEDDLSAFDELFPVEEDI